MAKVVGSNPSDLFGYSYLWLDQLGSLRDFNHCVNYHDIDGCEVRLNLDIDMYEQGTMSGQVYKHDKPLPSSLR